MARAAAFPLTRGIPLPAQPGAQSPTADVARPECEDWCTTHQDPVTGEGDGLCRSRTIEVGQHLLMLQRDGGHSVVRVGGSSCQGQWIELDDAPWLTQLMCSLLQAATATAPAEQEAVHVVAGLVGTCHQQLADCLGVDLENAAVRQAERMAGALAVHGVSISDN
jgi:hypothetical protein